MIEISKDQFEKLKQLNYPSLIVNNFDVEQKSMQEEILFCEGQMFKVSSDEEKEIK
jgi:hypothetical protein